MNGFGRSAPPGHGSVIGHMKAFAGPNSARTMRRLGVRYVVLHTARLPDRGRSILEEALLSPDFRPLEQVGTDYLFEVLPQPGTPGPIPGASPAR